MAQPQPLADQPPRDLAEPPRLLGDEAVGGRVQAQDRREHAELPEGEWIDVFTGLRYRGGRTIALHRDLDSIPVLVRPGIESRSRCSAIVRPPR